MQFPFYLFVDDKNVFGEFSEILIEIVEIHPTDEQLQVYRTIDQFPHPVLILETLSSG